MKTSKTPEATSKFPAMQSCLYCGGTAFTWGKLHAQAIRFVPENKSMLSFPWLKPVQGRRCDTCGNIQLFDDTAEIQ